MFFENFPSFYVKPKKNTLNKNISAGDNKISYLILKQITEDHIEKITMWFKKIWGKIYTVITGKKNKNHSS
jgi:hypothetical protein